MYSELKIVDNYYNNSLHETDEILRVRSFHYLLDLKTYNLICDQRSRHRVYRIDLPVVSKYDVLRFEFFSSLAKGR